MPTQSMRSLQSVLRGAGRIGEHWRQGRLEGLLNHLGRDRAGTQDARLRTREIDDGRFETNAAPAAIKNEIDVTTKVFGDMQRGGWADAAEAVGARRREPCATCLDQFQRKQAVGEA